MTRHILDKLADRAISGLQALASQHRRSLIGGSIALLAGFGITAIAVAPLAPDANALPRQVISEVVLPEGMAGQLAELAAQELKLTRSDITRGTDTAEALLARMGVRDAPAASFIRSDSTARLLLSGRGGKMVRVDTDGYGGLQELVARFPVENSELARTHFTRLTLVRVDGSWLARLETAPFTSQSRLASGTIRSSLFAATDEAGVPDAVAVQVADIFSTDIDFHRQLRKGDTFSLVYESLMADGEPVAWNEGAGRVLAAEFVNAGRSHHAVFFTAADGRAAYYDIDGSSKRRAFLASPLEFSRVTSGFAMRIHPIFQTRRAHLGVDYGAPTGTPVRVVADGVIDFAGRQNGYGNVIEVRHGNNRSTLYAHLSRIDVRKGQRVDQGQRIGAVGATGWATGPHLHYEFRIGGQHQDPLRMAKNSESKPVDVASRPLFTETLSTLQVKLDRAESQAGTRAVME